jgi:hypothetical protein
MYTYSVDLVTLICACTVSIHFECNFLPPVVCSEDLYTLVSLSSTVENLRRRPHDTSYRAKHSVCE